MVTFIARLEGAPYSELEFYFVSVGANGVRKYFVTTIDADKRSHVFYMIENNGRWLIDTSQHFIPHWILHHEEELENIIKKKNDGSNQLSSLPLH